MVNIPAVHSRRSFLMLYKKSLIGIELFKKREQSNYFNNLSWKTRENV
jgi:hypothetical protein